MTSRIGAGLRLPRDSAKIKRQRDGHQAPLDAELALLICGWSPVFPEILNPLCQRPFLHPNARALDGTDGPAKVHFKPG